MGINLGSFLKVLLGVGLGVLAVSCLTVTIVFGRYSNSFSAIEKNIIKISFDSSSSMIDSSIAIAVLGCFSAVAAIATISLSILMEEQTIILIIVGGISSLFAFGCIVAEGVFTQKSFDNYLIQQESILKEYSHKGAQKYIKKSIKKLYEQAIQNFPEKDMNYFKDVTFPSWKSVEDQLGKVDEDNHVFTYSDIWAGSDELNEQYFNISFYIDTNRRLIFAKYYRDNKYVPVATYSFIYYDKNMQSKTRCCWFNSQRTEIKCKNIKNPESYNNDYKMPDSYSDLNDEEYSLLNENIVVGTYYSAEKQDKDSIDVSYGVYEFPMLFKLITYQQYSALSDSIYSKVYMEDSTLHYKVSAKKWMKSIYNYEKDENNNPNVNYFVITPKKIKNHHDYIYLRQHYGYSKIVDKEANGYVKYFNSYYFNNIEDIIEYNYKDSNRGKIAPGIKKQYKQYNRKYNGVNESLKYSKCDLYQVALINMIIQIFCILLWATARFIPTNENNQYSERSNTPKDDKNPQNDKVEDSA